VAGTEGSRITQAGAEAQAGTPAPTGTPVHVPGEFRRYAAFVTTGVALALVFLSVFASGGEPGVFLGTLVLALSVGLLVWGPIWVFSVFPGSWIFMRIRRSIRGGRMRNLIGTTLASLAVAAVGATLGILGTLVLGRFLWGAGGSLAELGVVMMQAPPFFFAFGAPAAMVSGYLFYGREDRGHV
jgi:hypothetical protein